MNLPTLPPDDLPSPEKTEANQMYRHLTNTIRRCFYESCDGVIQALLLNCDWNVSINAGCLTLEIHSHKQETDDRLLNWQDAIAHHLLRFADPIIVRIYPIQDPTQPCEQTLNERL
jgi:hypothetical protein